MFKEARLLLTLERCGNDDMVPGHVPLVVSSGPDSIQSALSMINRSSG